MEKGAVHTRSPPSASDVLENDCFSPRKKKGLFKRWGRRSSPPGTTSSSTFSPKADRYDHDESSTQAMDGSDAGSSTQTEQVCNRYQRKNWLRPIEEDQPEDHLLISPSLKKNASPLTPGSDHSDSPVGVDQFPVAAGAGEHGNENSEDSDDTPKTKTNKRSVSTYFNVSSAVLPLPFPGNANVPEVTRQTSRQYKPLLPHDTPQGTASVTATPVAAAATSRPRPDMEQQRQTSTQDLRSPGAARKRNSLETALKGDLADRRPSLPRRSPTYASSDEQTQAQNQTRLAAQTKAPATVTPPTTVTATATSVKNEDWQERGRAPLRSEILVDYSERSMSPPTIDTRLQSTVDSRMQSTVDTRNSSFSRMHYSVNSKMSKTPKLLPADPNATIFIPIQPGIRVPLRRVPEVERALQEEFYNAPACPCCQQELAVIADAAFIYCPLCKEISPLFGNIRAIGNYPQEPEYLRFGLGLGMTWETMKKVCQEIQQR